MRWCTRHYLTECIHIDQNTLPCLLVTLESLTPTQTPKTRKQRRHQHHWEMKRCRRCRFPILISLQSSRIHCDLMLLQCFLNDERKKRVLSAFYGFKLQLPFDTDIVEYSCDCKSQLKPMLQIGMNRTLRRTEQVLFRSPT